MKTIEDNVQQQFGLHIEAMVAAADGLSEVISKASQRLVDSLLNDGKILVGGNGASFANALHFSNALLNRYDVERPSLPAIHLTGHIGLAAGGAHDTSSDQALSRQILALGQSEDILVLLTTDGQGSSLIHALDAAHERGMIVVALTGQDGGVLVSHLSPNDVEIRVQLYHPARIREIHLFILHCFCQVIEYALFGHEGDGG